MCYVVVCCAYKIMKITHVNRKTFLRKPCRDRCCLEKFHVKIKNKKKKSSSHIYRL